jgi:hypothetical protein
MAFSSAEGRDPSTQGPSSSSMVATIPERNGCARPIELIFGLAVGWSFGALFFGRFSSPPHPAVRLELLAAIAGGFLGVLLPKIAVALEKLRIPREVTRSVFTLVAAAVLGATYKKLFTTGALGAMLALSFAVCIVFLLDATVGGAAGIITPLAKGARKLLGNLLLKSLAAAFIGVLGGLLRIHLGVQAVTAAADTRLFIVMVAAGSLAYPLLLAIARGRKEIAGWRIVLPVVDSFLYAVCLAFVMLQPEIWASALPHAHWLWIPLGVFLGLSFAIIIGGIQSILLLLLDNPVTRFLAGLLIDGHRKLSGQQKGAVETPPSPATTTPAQRAVSAVVGMLAFGGMMFFGLLTVCFGRGNEIFRQDDRDVARLKEAGCPPRCARGDYAGWGIAHQHMPWADFAGADLSGAMLLDGNFTGASFCGAKLRRAQLTFVTLQQADLAEADLRGVILTGARLRRADLRGANLEGAQLQRADLTDALLDRANLQDAVFDAETIWPSGFDAKRAHARLDGSR